MDHVYLSLLNVQTAICGLVETGKPPFDGYDRQKIIPLGGPRTRDGLLFLLDETTKQLIRAVLKADPLVHLDTTWEHCELGAMHWRAWLLFAHAHLLDHLQQVQQMHTLIQMRRETEAVCQQRICWGEKKQIIPQKSRPKRATQTPSKASGERPKAASLWPSEEKKR